MKLSPQYFSDDIRLCKRATVGGGAGLAALLAWALIYVALYGTDGLSMTAYLARWSFLSGTAAGIGVACGFAVHLLRAGRDDRG